VLLIILAATILQQVWGLGDPSQKLLGDLRLFETQAATDTEPAVFVTLWDVLVAVMIVVIGHLVTHNLKRIHDLLIMPVAGVGDVGSRYAAFALIRYALLAVVYMVAMLNVGFSFETIGWFATAASVGLGFGLQEIVANFISGLILLFERPIRVGDIVTIGATSGTVEEISMRATVVTNWERQSLIIPNKKFVTENLTNWTRNDRVMRRDLAVRVAYGTDVEAVLRLLDGIVGGHPAVLADPPHRIWFQEFGPYGIEFKVLFFTHIEDGLRTRSELHAAISARFAAEGIEIPVALRELPAASG